MSKKEISKSEMAENFIFADALESYSQGQMESIFDELMYNENDESNPTLGEYHWQQLEDEPGFAEPDLVVLHGGPNEEEERQRFEAFENFMQFVENEPDVLVNESYMNMIVNSRYVSESEINPIGMRPESTVDEVDAAVNHSDMGERVVAISNDYHVPRIEDLFDQALRGGREPESLGRSYLPWPSPTAWFDNREQKSDRNDYLVIGAQFDQDEEDYGGKWNSESVREYLPQGAKNVGKAAAGKIKNLLE